MTRLIHAIAIFVLLFSVTLKIPLVMAALTWDTEVVDLGFDVGLGSSIALDGGNNIHVSYYDADQGDLKYAFKPLGGLTWDVDTVDFGVLPASPPLGLCTSIAIDGWNNIHVSYYDADQGDLKYAFKPLGGLTWDVDTVDSHGETGHYSSIALDEFDIPHISYYRKPVGPGRLMYASKTGATWDKEMVPDYSSDDIGLYASLALDRFNIPHISYYDADYGNLRYANKIGGTWNPELVDGSLADDVGRSSSIAVGEMFSIHISYIDAQIFDLKYAYKSNPDPLLPWDKDVVDPWVITHPLDAYDMFTSIALDEWDNPHISYHDSQNHYVKYATKIGATWNPNIVEGIPSYQNLNLHSSIALDEWSVPQISYYTMLDMEFNEGLKHARLVGDIPPVASFTEDSHTVPVCTPIAFDPSGSSDSDGTIVLYEWDFDGDGIYDLSTITPDMVSHIYTALGTYTVTLKVTDNDGLTDTATDTKTIVPARTLAAEVVSDESTGTSWHPSLGLGSDGTVHIAWDDNTQNGGLDFDRDIFYRRYELATGWTGTEVVSDESTSTSWRPSLGVGSDGTVHIAWQDHTPNYADSGTDHDIFYRRYEVGVGWSPVEVVSEQLSGDSESPSLAVDSSGNVHIAWQDLTDYGGAGTDADVFYRRYEVGVGWTTTEVVSDESTDNSWRPSLGLGSDGTVHIAWGDNTPNYADSGTDQDIFYKRRESATGLWTGTEVVSTESTDNSANPSLGICSCGTVHIAWEDPTPNYADSGTDRDIFYKRYAARVQVATATGTGTAYFEPDAGTITGLAAVDEATLPTAGKPVGVTFPDGLFSFTIEGLTPGQTVTVEIELSSAFPVGSQYWKFQESIGWFSIPIGSDDGDNIITITVTDGATEDADGSANGVFVDPGGPAILVQPQVWSTDSLGNPKSTFLPGEEVYVRGSGFPPNIAYDSMTIYIIPDGADALPGNAVADAIGMTDDAGALPVTLTWSSPLTLGEYDIWVDVNQNDIFDTGDAWNDEAIDIFAFNVIPEVPFGTAMTLLSMIFALIGFLGFKRFRPNLRPQ